eukprot:Sspe_Gene.93578::Locus_66178_Transcript_1_1_Confidence_1.000_Length_417::g.93578::m.93578
MAFRGRAVPLAVLVAFMWLAAMYKWSASLVAPPACPDTDRRAPCGTPPPTRFVSGNASAPPLLWSFPGSGNSWLRLLVERATGVYTGSVYHKDQSMRAVFRGEDFCNSSVIAIKAHHKIPFRCRAAAKATRAVLL